MGEIYFVFANIGSVNSKNFNEDFVESPSIIIWYSP